MNTKCLVFGYDSSTMERVRKGGIEFRYPFLPEEMMDMNAKAVSMTYFFYHKRGDASDGEYDDCMHHPNVIRRGKFLELPGLSSLSEKDVAFLFDWSVDAHLNVFYQAADWSFTVSLCQLFPYRSIIDEVSNGDIAPEDIPDLTSLVDSLPSDTYVFGFTHDADTMLIFGNLALLERIRDAHHEFLKEQGLWP